MKNYFDTVKKQLENYNHLGEQILQDRTLLIGKAPHIAPKAWLHGIYKPLSNDEVEKLEYDMQLKIPSDYKFFLTNYSNGLNIFVDVFSLDGFRKRSSRNIEDAYQPYSIINPNTKERLEDAEADMFFIGGYNWDGSLLYMKNGKAYRCSSENIKPLNTWDSFEKMLLTEINRICLLYDKNGVEIEAEKPTVPSPFFPY
ncbi:MAG: 1,3-beta-glucan synthase regulator [Candidatus Nephrothrix sp. EaCA]|nr:MAG: 1,3-beta-glucan synthase regulator [Candidatus Nephrothrix sp. EaCA]